MELATYLTLCTLLVAVFFGAFALGRWIASGPRDRRHRHSRSRSRIARRLDQAQNTLPDHPA